MISIVVSVYNEQDMLKAFFKALTETLENAGIAAEVIFVNDGSVDNSLQVLMEISRQAHHVKVINFSRNFGHESAMLAGIDHSIGDMVICLDADLQHPPAMIPEMLKAFREGADVVSMVRTERGDGSIFKKWLSAIFYKLINKISPVNFEPNASDFFLISRRVADIMKENYRERTRFLRGYIQMVGFRRSSLSYAAGARTEGQSKYSVSRLFMLSLGAVVSFSKLPLHLGIIIGVIFGVFSLVVGGYSIYMKFCGDTPPGYTTLVVFMSFSFSIMFFLIGIIGVYIGYNFDESKKRPIYIVDSKTGFDKQQ